MCRLRRIVNSLKWRRSRHTERHTSQSKNSGWHVQDPHTSPPSVEPRLRRSRPSTGTTHIFDQDIDTAAPIPLPVPKTLAAQESVLSAEPAPAPEPHAVEVDGLANAGRSPRTGPLRQGIAVTVMQPAGYVQIGEVVLFGISVDGGRKIPGDLVTIEPNAEDVYGQ